ncbi:AraC family transcriptional regulator [Parapedobacter koreensis]|uniref:AraC-like ligand binding domain-containing protein n=1 Tax=Parapedobacter koreensis TaxID=332977 RepID=A0A1H7EZB3_9SPHI|nr:response regulator transcription factor [Parapedobacter koreensis]SEK19191.1 AraC-like ligand binding domain-containing protein [Parapedobacter koreensis]
MKTYHKYLPVSTRDEQWGLYTLNTGFGQIPLSSAYPSRDHPATYYFDWQHGRVLDEYQLIYITHGEGLFESKTSGAIAIQEGSIILLFPDEWHRYKPNENTGWNEYWVGFKGPIADQLVKNKFFSRQNPIIRIGFREEIVAFFNDICARTNTELTGYQPLISGEILHLLGSVHAISKENALHANRDYEDSIVNKARIIFRENVETSISAEQVAQDLGLSYSQFRKVFKKYTGISPGQYLIQLKIEKAKLLLTFPNKLIKEVAYDLGFDSCFYFSKLFKEKTGLSPANYRDRYMRPVSGR